MIFRTTLMAGALGALAACQPAVPDSGAGAPGRGVGFDNSLQAQQARDAALAGRVASVPAPAQVQSQALGSTVPTAPASPSASPVVANAEAALARTADEVENTRLTQANSGQQVLVASPSNPSPVIINNPAISDENDFDAVAGRQSIESDKARIERNRSQYQVVAPTALPSRSGDSQPNIVQYALQTSHPVGTQVHNRFSFASANKTARNCAVYSSADEAQIDFLARGGPTKDRKALDPDGDGYACGWNPAVFRRAAGN